MSIGISLGMQLGRDSQAPASGLTYTWTDLGIDAYISGKTLKGIFDTKVWDGKVFVGWGNSNGDDRPLRARYYDPNDTTWHDSGLGDLAADAIPELRTIAGNLYQLNGDTNAADAATTEDYYRWTAYNSPAIIKDRLNPGTGANEIIHLIDMTRHDDGTLYIAGSGDAGGGSGTGAQLWRSTDNGATWTLVQSNYSDISQRYFFVHSYGGYLWVQSGNSSGGALASSEATAWKSSDGTSWSNSGIDLIGSRGAFGGRGVRFNGYLLFYSKTWEGAFGDLRRFDGATAVSCGLPGSGRSVVVDGGYVYSNHFGSRLYRSADGISWTIAADGLTTTFGGVGHTSYSFDAIDGVFYLGNQDGHVWKGVPSPLPSTTIWVDEHGSAWVDENGDSWM